MNSRSISTPVGQRTRWWGKAAFVGGAMALGLSLTLSTSSSAQFPESFDGATFPPTSWARFQTGPDATRQWVRSTANPRTGAGHASMQFSATATLNTDYLATPQFTPTAGQNLEFWEREQFSGSFGSTFEVRVSTASQTTPGDYSTLLWSRAENNVLSYQQRVLSLAAFVGTPIYVAFIHINNDGDTWRVDDVTVAAPPACPAPTSAAASSITSTTALANWTSGGGSGTFIVEYGPSATFTTPGTGATAGVNGTVIDPATSPQLIGGLTPSTAYRYFVRQNCGVDGFSTNSAAQTFTTLAPPPANDECSNAIAMASCTGGPQSVSGTTLNSTVDAIYSNCGAGGSNTTERGVWYIYTGDNNAVTVSTCNATGYDSRITVYSGSCGALVCEGGNDDDATCVSSGLRSKVTFNANLGTNYYVFVHGFQTNPALSATGNFVLSWTCSPLCLPVPANDLCASAQAITVDAAAIAGDNTCASATVGNPACESAFLTLPDVYYSFTASAGGSNIVTINTVTATNMGYAIYSSCGGPEVACVATVVSGTPTTHSGLIGGNTYFIRVETNDGSTGTFDIAVTTPCQPAGTATAVPNCGTNEFFIDVNVTSLGTSADLDITTNFLGDTEPTGVGTGVTQIGPYPSGTNVIVTLVHDNGGACNLALSGVSFTCPPANDACANAIAINCNSTTAGSTVASTIDAVPTCVTALNTAGGVWYTVTGSGGQMTAGLCGASYDSKIGIFTTADCVAFTCVTGEDDDCGDDPQVSWASTVGTTYHILVTGFGTNVGTFDLEVACEGENTPPCQDNGVSLELRTDDFADETTWEIVPEGLGTPVCQGGGFSDNQTITVSCCLLDGCYSLRVLDSFGDGMSLSTPADLAGYRLFDANGKRIIDNWQDGQDFTSVSSAALGFCVPIGTDRVIDIHCDRENWLPNEVIIATENPAVSAQWGIGNQTDDGYQFWFYNPDGGYTRRIFRDHATSGGNGPANAQRAQKLKLSAMVTSPLPSGVLLNVRVRSRVNGGAYTAFGPACRFKIDPTACTITQLNNVVASPNYSCGVSGKSVGASGNAGKIFANVVTSGGNPATNYRFEISLLAEGYTRNAVSNTAVLQLAAWQTLPLLCGTYTYDVRVQASFDGGTTYCPYGPVCTVEITNNNQFCTAPGAIVGGGDRSASFDQATFAMYPNPNNGGELFFNMSKLDASVNTVSVDIFDTFGKRAMTATLPVQDGMVSDVIELGSHMAAGLYMVNITAGTTVTTERLVIQR